MLSIRLDPAIEQRLSALSKRTGRIKSYFARELIEGNIDDLEGRYLVEARLQNGRPSLTSRQVQKELGAGYGISTRRSATARNRSYLVRIS